MASTSNPLRSSVLLPTYSASQYTSFARENTLNSPILSSRRLRKAGKSKLAKSNSPDTDSGKRHQNLTLSRQTTPTSSLNHLKLKSRKLGLGQVEDTSNERLYDENLEDQIKKSTLNLKESEKYARKIPKCAYDSDDYNQSYFEKREKLKKWENTEIDPENGHMKKKIMFHIYYGVSVPYKSWKNAIKSKTSYGYLRELVVPHIWTREEFVKRAVQIKRTLNSENRLELTPRKEKLLNGDLFNIFCTTDIYQIRYRLKQKKTRDAGIEKFCREMGIIISQERIRYEQEVNNQN